MSLIKLLSAKRQISCIWDLGRVFLSSIMGGVGIFLLSTLILNALGITARSPLRTEIFCYIPLIPFMCCFSIVIFDVFTRLKDKCKSEWDFWMIMLSFSLAGMFIMPVRKFIFHLVGITVKTPLWIKILVYIPIIPPTYYVGLMVFGTLLGQSSFFWGMISKRLKFLTGRQNIKH